MQFLRNAIKAWLLRRNIILSRPPGQFNISGIKLKQIRDRGLKIDVALDGGAYEGGFAEELREVYPDAQVVMVEPRQVMQQTLKDLAASNTGLHVAQCLLGPQDGMVELNEYQSNSSILANARGQAFGERTTHQMITIDHLMARLKLPWPDLIKLDLQGYELEALKGATEALKHAEAVYTEGSFMPFQKGQPLIADVIAFLDQAGFQLYDILLLGHRPLDGALAQGDFVFVRKTSKLVADHRWSETSAWS